MKELVNMKFVDFVKISTSEWWREFCARPTMLSKTGMLFWFPRWFIRVSLIWWEVNAIKKIKP